MKLTKAIFYYWTLWMKMSAKDNDLINGCWDEGLCYTEDFPATFWWVLNKEWYKMHNKVFSYTDCDYNYIELMEYNKHFKEIMK